MILNASLNDPISKARKLLTHIEMALMENKDIHAPAIPEAEIADILNSTVARLDVANAMLRS